MNSSSKMSAFSAIWPDCEAFEYVKNSKAAVMLIHGFTATPLTMKELALFIHSSTTQDLDVFGVRLPGHATNIEDLRRIQSADYFMHLQEVYHNLSKKYTQIHIIGLSFGALLALHLCKSAHFCSVSLLAPFLEPTHPNIYGLPKSFVVNIFEHLHHDVEKNDPSLLDPAARKLHKTYHTYPIEALDVLFKTVELCKNGALDLKLPMQIIHSIHDSTSRYTASEEFVHHVQSEKARIIRLNHSDHIITEDYQKDFVFDQCLDWIRLNSPRISA